MSDIRMGTAEARFADIIWEREPITSGELAQIGLKEFHWKRTTSHTVLTRLCDRGSFQKEMNGSNSRRLLENRFFTGSSDGRP